MKEKWTNKVESVRPEELQGIDVICTSPESQEPKL